MAAFKAAIFCLFTFKFSCMHLYRIIFPVNDIEKAVMFYSNIFDQEGTRVYANRHYFNLGGTILVCYDPYYEQEDKTQKWVFEKNQYIYIAVTNLEKVYEKVINSDCKYLDEKIEQMPWGERLFYANDPFGNPICFVDETTIFTG